MILAAAQMGHLSASPKGWGRTRLEQYKREKVSDGMPVIEHGRYILESFIEIGPTRPTGMGDTTLDWHNLVAYSQATGTISEDWEFRLLMDMSRSYLSYREDGMNPLAMRPVDIINGR